MTPAVHGNFMTARGKPLTNSFDAGLEAAGRGWNAARAEHCNFHATNDEASGCRGSASPGSADGGASGLELPDACRDVLQHLPSGWDAADAVGADDQDVR